MEPELIDAIGDYLHAHVRRHGHAPTAEAFGVSRHTLWRFLERGQPGRTLPRAVIAKAGDTPRTYAAPRSDRQGRRHAPEARRSHARTQGRCAAGTV